MHTYLVDVTYTFSGYFVVLADSREEAERKINQDCGVVLGGGVQTTLEDEEIDWEFSLHPESAITSTRRVNRKIQPT